MSKVTPSALRGLSVAAGTVGLAAAGAAAMAGQACAAESGAGGGLPVSTNAVPALLRAVAHSHGTVAGMPLSDLPVLGQLPEMRAEASPTPDALPGLGYADLGELPVTRSRAAQPERAAYVPQHAAVHAMRTTHAVHADAATTAPAPAAPAPAAAARPQAPAAAPAQFPPPQLPPAQAAAAQRGPLDNVNEALHGLPVAGQLVGPGHSLPVVGGLSSEGLSGLAGGLSSLGG